MYNILLLRPSRTDLHLFPWCRQAATNYRFFNNWWQYSRRYCQNHFFQLWEHALIHYNYLHRYLLRISLLQISNKKFLQDVQFNLVAIPAMALIYIICSLASTGTYGLRTRVTQKSLTISYSNRFLLDMWYLLMPHQPILLFGSFFIFQTEMIRWVWHYFLPLLLIGPNKPFLSRKRWINLHVVLVKMKFWHELIW